MLSRTAFQVARAPTSAFAPLASTSRAVPLLHAPAQQQSQRTFAVSAPASESRGKRKTRLVRKANLDKKAQLVRQHEQSRPDPVLGYAQGNQELWDKSLLKQILLRKEDVWAGKGGAGSAAEEEGTAASSSKEHYTPQLFNFGLTAETAHQLSDLLPPTAALRSTLGDQATSVGSVMVSRFEDATRAEQDKRDTLMRIVDLRNADSKGIEVENTRRIVEAFGRVPGDTASPEVQAAILTMRIRSLSSHLIALPRDIQNRQALRLMISRRTRLLKYLRKVSVTRYEDVLDKIGVEPRAVEGEVVITKEDLRTMIRGQ